MANRVAKFETITEDNYNSIVKRNGLDQIIPFDQIKLPVRATKGSAGYDIYATKDVDLQPGESTVIFTLLRCKIDPDWMMFAMPKSGLGFKYHMMLANTIGLIDSDYYFSKTDDDTNEGHIMIKIVNGGDKRLVIEKGKKFCQVVFIPYGITEDDNVNEERNGGIGSTKL